MYKRLNDEVIETEVDGKTVTRTLGYIKRDSDKAIIPMNEANADYLQYLKDVKAGAKVTDYDYAAEEARQVAAEIVTEAASEREELIQERIRDIAVNELVTEGKIEADAEIEK